MRVFPRYFKVLYPYHVKWYETEDVNGHLSYDYCLQHIEHIKFESNLAEEISKIREEYGWDKGIHKTEENVIP